MKREIELALQNVDSVCANVNLNRQQHAELARNIKMIRDELVAADSEEGKKKSKAE